MRGESGQDPFWWSLGEGMGEAEKAGLGLALGQKGRPWMSGTHPALE